MNFLLAVIFNNYKKLISEENQLFIQQKEKYFDLRFAEVDENEDGFITVEKMTEIMGGQEVVDKDERLRKILW